MRVCIFHYRIDEVALVPTSAILRCVQGLFQLSKFVGDVLKSPTSWSTRPGIAEKHSQPGRCPLETGIDHTD
jgi:hypothetical protein